MLKRLFAPFLVLSLALSVIVITTLNSDILAQPSEADQDYFIKPIPRANVVVVEPNYGRFYHPSDEVEGDASGEILYNSLEEVKKDYEIKRTEMISFERKGKVIPNLYVHVDSIDDTTSQSEG